MVKVLADGIWCRDDGVFEVDPDIVYPQLLKELGVKPSDLTQYWLEVAYQCAKLDVQRLAASNGLDRRAEGLPLQIHIRSGKRKDKWQLHRRPTGDGVWRASKGGEARKHYVRIRGKLPD